MLNVANNIIVKNVITGEVYEFPDRKMCAKVIGISVEDITAYRITKALYKQKYLIENGVAHPKKIVYSMSINQDLYNRLKSVISQLPNANIKNFSLTIINDFVFNYKNNIESLDENLIKNFKKIEK